MSAGEHHLRHVISTTEERSLVGRDLVSWGGYGLQISPCIDGTSPCGDSCCPNGYQCASAGDHRDNFEPTEAICCPTDADCSATVKIVPACADSSWGLYHAIAEFCCPTDFVGIYPEGGTGLMCLSNSLPIPPGKLAASVKQFTSTNAAVATAGPGSSSSSSLNSRTTSAGSGTVTSGPDSESPASPTNNSSESGGLSNGATIAIAVLATAFGLLSILVIGYFVWRKKRKSRRHAQSSSDPSNVPEKAVNPHSAAAETSEVRVNELSGRIIPRSADTTELDSSHRAELYDTGRMQ